MNKLFAFFFFFFFFFIKLKYIINILFYNIFKVDFLNILNNIIVFNECQYYKFI